MAEPGLGWSSHSKQNKLLNELGGPLHAHSWQPVCRLALPVTIRARVITLACPLSTKPQHLPNNRNKGRWTLHQNKYRQIHTTNKTSEPEGGYCYKVATFTASKPTRASRAGEVDTKAMTQASASIRGCTYVVW